VPHSNKPTEYQTLVRQLRSRIPPKKTSEERLDALLDLREKRRAEKDAARSGQKVSQVERLRQQMRAELVPVFEDLRQKYESAGVFMELDAEGFLAGGVNVMIDIEFDVHAMRLEGTVTEEGIAFQEARYSNNVRGVVTAGRMLRGRALTAHEFRDFLCDRISQLVRSATSYP